MAIASLKKSRFGRQCIAIKHDELAAASMGIHVSRVKLVVFTLAGAISALGGYLYVHTLGYLDSGSFGWDQSSMWIIMVFFGGINSLTGAVFAGILLNMLPEVFRFSNELRVILYCVIVLFTVNYRPRDCSARPSWTGDAQAHGRFVKRLATANARRRGGLMLLEIKKSAKNFGVSARSRTSRSRGLGRDRVRHRAQRRGQDHAVQPDPGNYRATRARSCFQGENWSESPST